MSSLSEPTSELVEGALPRGVTPPSGAGGRFLSDVIVGLGFADRETVNQALDGSRAPGKKLGTTLVEMGALSERQLGRAVAERYRLDFVDLSEFDIDPEAVHVLGDAEMRRYEAVPVAFTEDGALVVAMIDPADWLAAEEMAQLTGRRIRRAVAAPAQVIELIARVAEARSLADESGGDGSGTSTSSAMPSRLTLRPVTRPLAGPALGRTFGVEGPFSGDLMPEAQAPQVPTEAPVEPKAVELPPADAPDEAVEGQLVPLTPRASEATPPSEGVESPVHDLVEATAPEAEKPEGPEAALATPGPEENDHGQGAWGGELEPSLTPGEFAYEAEEEQYDTGHRADEVSVAPALEIVDFEPPEFAPRVDGPDVELPDVEPPSVASSHTQHTTEPELAAPPPDAPLVPLAQDAPAFPGVPADDRSEQLEAVQAELATARAELEETRTALGQGRRELESTRDELASVRSRHDGALERTAETERLLAESRTQVGRLEAELAAAHEQSRSLREDLSWARGQIEQRGHREDEALSELRGHIEAMQGLRPVGPPPQAAPSASPATPPADTPPASAPHEQPAAASSPVEPLAAPAPSPAQPVAPSTNGASAPPSNAPAPPAASPTSSGNGRVAPAEPDEAAGTTKARGLKRLIAAVRRL